MSKPKSVEQIIVEDLGAEITGNLEKLGEFLAIDGEERGDDYLEAALNWLKGKRLMTSKSSYSHTVGSTLAGGETLVVQVYKGIDYTEYRFRPEKELRRKSYHLIEVHVFIPSGDDAA